MHKTLCLPVRLVDYPFDLFVYIYIIILHIIKYYSVTCNTDSMQYIQVEVLVLTFSCSCKIEKPNKASNAQDFTSASTFS